MKKVIIFICVLFLTFDLFSQVTQEWVRTFDGPPGTIWPATDQGKAIDVDNFGNVFVTGYTIKDWDLLQNRYDFVTIKYDSTGNQIWAKIYNGTGDSTDIAFDIILNSSGDVYVTGLSSGINSDADIVTIKYNSTGIQQWVARYNGNHNIADEGKSIAIDSKGNVYVAGKTASVLTYDDFIILKYDSSGNLIWSRIISGPGNDWANKIVVDKNDFIYATGISDSLTGDFLTIKCDTLGNIIWSKYYNGTANSSDEAKDIVVDTLGNVFVCGTSQGYLSNNDIVTLKYDQNGNQDWVKRCNGNANRDDNPYGIVSDNNGNVFVCGDNIPTLSSFENYFIIKYDLFGNQIWFQSIDSTGNDDFAFAIAIDKFGDVYCTGTFHVNQENIVTIKFSNSGVRLWTRVFTDIGGDDRGFAVKVDSNLNIYVTGDVNRGGCDVDMVTIKYSQVDVFHSIHENKINSNVKIIPNPFNEYSILTFANPQNEKHTLTILNTTGQIIQQKDNITTSEIKIERENMAKGLYFFQLRSVSNIVASGKLIVE